MNVCSHCGQPWDAPACRLPGSKIKVELADKAPPTLMPHNPDHSDGGDRDDKVLGR